MKIIIRDVIRNYFPKHLTNYESLSQTQKQSIFSCFNKSESTNNKEEVIVPQMIVKKSSVSKEKAFGVGGKRSLGKDDVIKSKQPVINSNGVKQQNHLTLQEEQRVAEIMSQRLKSQITNFITTHRFYISAISYQHYMFILSKLLLSITPNNLFSSSSTKSRSAPKPPTTTALAQPLYKLSLYLNKQTNKQIFAVYEHILAAGHRTGISYETLAKKLKTDIINVSHYCCKLKKMRFVDWEHKKQGVVVFPKVGDTTTTKGSSKSINKDQQLTTINLNQHQPSFDYSKSFIFNQLTLNQNILINVSSSTSLLQGGLTNQQIKFKIMKHAQNKMVRRTVQGMKHIQRHAQRQGKVFEFKYKRESQKMIRQMDRKRVENSGVIQLTGALRAYLNENYASMAVQPLVDQELLQHIVNTKLTDYVSSIGIKQSKRQCTPLKLNRYIYILNYLQIQGPQTELDLRRHIIEVQKDLQTYQGIIHKRSVMGILEGLKKIKLIEEDDGWYYPKWIEVKKKEKVQKRPEDYEEDLEMMEIRAGNKKVKTDNRGSKDNRKGAKNEQKITIPMDKIRMITKRQHLSQIFTQLLNFTFQKALKRVLRKGFHRIMYTQRKKQSIPMFVPQPNIFHLLNKDSKDFKPIQQHATTLESFMAQVNNFVSTQGKTLQNFPEIQYQVVKFVRRNPNKNADNLRSKYGKGWREKFELLESKGVIKITEQGYETVESFDGYLV